MPRKPKKLDLESLTPLKQAVLAANKLLVQYNLVTLTWGNVSGIDRKQNLVVIKPSGVEYAEMTADDMVVLTLDGNVVDSKLNPSSDTQTHLELYKNFPNIGGVVHTHSRWATVFSQMGKPIEPLGTTHADYFSEKIPCTRNMTANEVAENYELNTGKLIVDTFKHKNPDYLPAVLVKHHAPFVWGVNPQKAVENALVLEEVAQMAYFTGLAGKGQQIMPQYLLDKHFFRKHGDNAYYGQK
ncbi:MAG: L-ribulose-5-phosphate 4-epimerase [Defluviitaleaceae bacterium]|nr:L-ribulose-5-phosphate 4-epimerase [Defluviitaleaceae bacterium]